MVEMILLPKQTQRHRRREQTCGCQEGKLGRGMNWETGIDIHTLLILCTKLITSENLLSGTGNPIQCPCGD